MIQALLDHLWQSSLFALLIGAITPLFRKNGANIRFSLWMAASLKFLLPFSVFVSLGEWIRGDSSPAQTIAPLWAEAFSPMAATSSGTAASFLIPIWLCGAVFLMARWSKEWSRIRSALTTSAPIAYDAPLPVLVAPTRIEPGQSWPGKFGQDDKWIFCLRAA